MRFRVAELGDVDLTARTVPVVIATGEPYDRGRLIEILDLSKVDLSRGDLPLIESHDMNRLNIGQVRNVRVDGNVLRGDAVFGLSERAVEVFEDVRAGILTGVSIGYELLDEGEPVPELGPLARKFGFRPFEVSVVAVPADTRAGFFRAGTLTLKKTRTKGQSMKNQLVEIEPQLSVAAQILKIGESFPGGREMGIRAIETGMSVADFQKEAIRALSTKPLATADNVDQSQSRAVETMPVLRTADDFKSYYARRVQAANRGDEPIGLTHFMRGVARMSTPEPVQRAMSVGMDASGGYAVPSVVMPQILAALAPASSLIQAGAGVVPLTDGAKNYSFAAVDDLPTASWRLENEQIAESEPTFKHIVVTPRDLSFMVKMSRELLADALNIDAALQQAIAQAFAKEIDRVGLRGSGNAPEPRGLRNTSGVHSVSNGANGAQIASYGNLFSAVQAVLSANAGMPTAAIMSPRSLVRFGALADTTGQPIAVPSMLQGVRMISTSQVPDNLTVGTSSDCSEIYVGDFSQMAFAMRETLTVRMLEEAFASYGQIGFVCHARLDVVVYYPEAFAIVTGVR